MRTRFAVIAVTLSLLVPAVAAAQSLPPGGTFTDDNGNIHEGFIEAIAAEGITRGCNPPVNDLYCPSDSVTRGQMAAFLGRALGLTEGGTVDRFVDDDDSVFEADINRLAFAGITTGCTPTQYCPSDTLTRAQMAAFLVRAFGYDEGGDIDRFVDDDGSIFETDINKLAFAGVTVGCTDTEYCPRNPVRRDQMASFLGRALGLAPIPVDPVQEPSLAVVASGFEDPVDLDFADDRVFVTEREGTIRVMNGGATSTFLDISGPVDSSGGEMGLLSMEFHPDYPVDPRVFVYYSGALRAGGSGHHTSYVVSYEVSGNPDVLDAGSATSILQVDQPYANHNGGDMHFGPDGMLYIGMGDGGSGGDPKGHGQNNATLLGGMLRIDVDGTAPYEIPPDNPYANSAGADELWAIGLRNPWRFSFDGDDLYIADVGQGAREEVNVESAGVAGLNYGWNRWEGDSCFSGSCSMAGFTFPVHDYPHSGGQSVTGGWVYRGSALPQLDGHYFYADFIGGWVKSFVYDGSTATQHTDWPEFGAASFVSTFGRDAAGEIYIVTLTGTVYKVVPG